MNKVSVIKDINTKSIYGAVVHDDHLRAVAIPVAMDSVEWAAWLNDSRASFNDVKSVLDTNLQQELSVDIDRHVVKSVEQEFGPELARKIELFIPADKFIQDGKSHPTMGTSIVRKSLSKVPRTNLYSTPLNQIDAKDRQAVLNFKARRFRTDQKVTALNIQVKRVRAVFDANIGPGGGWRCPDGTLNGGQITDRFGRGCGGGLTRRIGRALMRAGQRLDDAGAGRDARRLARRTQAAVNRRERGERIREGRRAVANRLDAAADRLVGDFAPARPAGERRPQRTPSARRPAGRPGAGREESRPPVGGRREFPNQGMLTPSQIAEQLEDVRFDENGNLVSGENLPVEILPGGERGRRWQDMTDAELEEAFARNELQKPPTDGRVGFKPESEAEQRRKRANQAAIRAEQAFRRGEGMPRPADEADAGEADAPAGGRAPGRRPGRRPSEQRPVRPRRPQGERRPTPDADADRPSPSDSDDPFDFIEDPDERERVKEALGPWAKVLADLIRERRREEGRSGAPRPRRERRGAERGEESEEQRSLMQKIMDFFAEAIQRLGEFRERRGESRERRRARRDERRRRIADALDDAASRVLQEEGGPKRRRRGPARGGRRTDVNARARDAAERVVPDDDERSRWRNEVNKQWREERGIPDDLKELKDNELDAILDIVQNEENDFQANPDTFDMFVDERRRNLRRLNAEKRRRTRASREEQPAPAVTDGRQTPEAPAAPDSADLEGSIPDERSLRNVRNRFPRRGLPATAYWRDRERPGYNESSAQEMDRRFGRYYDQNGNINARGRYVNDRLRDEREANRRPLDADERERIETDANRQFDANNPPAADAPVRRPGQLEGLSDDEIRDRLRRYRGDNASEPFNLNDLDNDELIRLQNIIDNNPQAFADIDGRGHPARTLIGGEFNMRQDMGLLDSERRTPETNVPSARPQFDTPEQRREFVDRALGDNPQQPEDFGEIVRMWKDAGNVAALEEAFNRYQERERALERAEAQLRFAGHYAEADELRDRRKIIATARRQSLFALQNLNPDWGIDEVLNPPNDRNANVPEFGPGSEPDELSFRNVFNAFRQRGLPARPTWRDRDRRNYSEAREREFDRRFGRYYDANGDLNERGKYVNRKLRERRNDEGRPLTENEVAQVVVREEMENQERELSAPPVPDRAPAAVEGDDVWRQEIPRADIDAALNNDTFNRVREIVDRLERDGGGPDTPTEINDLINESNRINGLMRRIQERLKANSDGRISLSNDEVRDLKRTYDGLDQARRAMAPESFALFRDIDQTKVTIDGVEYNEGIFHPQFDEYREDFFRAHYAIPAGINAIIVDGDGREDEALAEVVSFVNQEWIDNGGNLGPGDFSGVLGWKNGGWNGMPADQRAETIRNLAMASISRNRINDYLQRRTGMDLDNANRMAVAASAMKQKAQQIIAQQQTLYNRSIPNDMSPSIQGRIDELKQNVDSYLASYAAMVQAAMPGLQQDGDVGNFLRNLGRRYSSERQLIQRDQGLFDGSPNQLNRQILLAQGHVGQVVDRLRDIDAAPIGVDRAADERRIQDIQRILANGAPSAVRGFLPTAEPLDKFLGEYVALSMTRTDLVKQQLETRKRNIQAAWGIPNAPDPNLGAQRNVNEPDGVVNGVVQDLISTDTEAGELIDSILENAQRKRRRALTALFRKKYPNETGNPWDNYKRRNGGAHPFSADTLAQDYASADDQGRRKIKDWLKNAYEVEVDGPQGTKATTKVDSVEWVGGEFQITGRIFLQFADGSTKNVGSMSRRVKTDGRIYSALFKIGEDNVDWDMITGRQVSKRANKWYYTDSGAPLPEDHHIGKGMGLATAVNGHSWGWLKDAGFKEVGVSPMWDGPYIWGRVGYRGSSVAIENVWQNAANEVLKYRNGQASIIKSDKQARMVTELARRANANNYNPASSPAQMELIYALEHGSTDENRSRRVNAVRSWIRSNAAIGGSTLYLDNHSFDAIDESTDPQDVQVNRRGVNVSGGSMLRGLVRPQPADPRRGQIATPVVTPGDLPEPRVIENASIKSPEQAVNFLRSGGSLDQVPNQYWIPAIQGNSSRTEVDAGSMFFEKPPRQGNMADTRIFLLRDAEGRPTNQGLVIKGSRPTPIGQGGYMDDVYAEVAGYNLAAAVGLMPEGAGYVGTAQLAPRNSGRGRGDEEVFVVIPHAANLAPGNGPLNRGAADYDPRIMANAPDRGLPARTAHYFHNFFLGAADRHDKNGGTFLDENGNAIVVPYDQGRIAVPALAAIPQYAWLGPDASVARYKFPMDIGLFQEMQDHVRSLSPMEATRFRREMLERYDEMVSRYRSSISGGRDEFIRRMSIGAPDTVGGRDVRAIRVQRLGEIYDHLKAKVDRAEEHKTYLKSKLTRPRGAR